MIKVKILAKDGTKVVKLTRSKAVRERCINCSGWSAVAATNCTEETCPLHPFRTGKGSRGKAQLRNQAISRYCHWCLQGRNLKSCVSQLCPLYAFRLGRLDESVVIEKVKTAFHGFPK